MRHMNKLFLIFLIVQTSVCTYEPTFATIYENYSEYSLTLSRKSLQNTCFKDNEKVLVIGSGDGKIAAQIAKSVPQGIVIGIDASAELVHLASDAFLNTPNLYFKQADYTSFEFEQRFDLIVSLNSLEYIENHPQLFRQIKRSLRNGGKIILSLSLPKTSTMADAIQTTLKNTNWKGLEGTYSTAKKHEMSLEDYRKCLEENGFKVVICEKSKHHTIFKTKEAFVQWLSTWLPKEVAIPEERSYEFSQNVATAFLAMTSQSSNFQIVYTHLPWEIEAIAR